MSKRFTLSLILLSFWLPIMVSTAGAQETRLSKKEIRQEKKKLRLDRKLARERFLQYGFVGTWNVIQDTKMAQNTYQGPGARLQIGVSSRSEKNLFQYAIRGGGIIASPSHDESTLWGALSDAGFSYMWRIRKDDPKNLIYLGAYGQFLYAYRFNSTLRNSARNWDIVGSVGPSLFWMREVRVFRQQMTLEYQLKVPVLSYLVRYPGFSIGLEGSDDFVSPVGVFTQIQSQISLVKRLGRKTENKLAFFYEWNLYDFKEEDIHALGVAYHGLGVTLFIDL